MQKFLIIEEEELKKIIRGILDEYFPKHLNVQVATEKKIIYSMKELAKFLKCSVPTVSKWKNEGIIPYYEIGPRKIQFDSEKVLDALHSHQSRSRKRIK
jgi:excisionase family DNA binding protein